MNKKGIRTLNETFTEEEFLKLSEAKARQSWHDFIIDKCLPKNINKGMFDIDLGDLGVNI